MSSQLQDFYLGYARQGRSDRFSIPLDGSHLSLGPFSFRPRSIMLVNQTGANLIAEDDRGEQYIAAASVGATYGTSDSVRFECWLDVAQTSGKCSVVVGEDPAGIAAAQLSSFAGASAGGTIKRVALADFPPASPTDGDAVFLSVAVGIEWLLIWNATTGFWDFAGGPELSIQTDALQGTPGLVGYGDFATVGPAVTVPRGGDYEVTISAWCRNINAFAGVLQEGRMSYSIGGAGAVDADSIHGSILDSVANQQNSAHMMRRQIKTGLALGTVLTLRGKDNQQGQMFVEFRRIGIVPIRVQ